MYLKYWSPLYLFFYLTSDVCGFVFRFPVVAMGVLKWVDWTVSEPRYFQLQTDHTPIHLALLDEVWPHCLMTFLGFIYLLIDAILTSNFHHADLYVSPAAAPAGPPAAHQAVWDWALPAGCYGAGVLPFLHLSSLLSRGWFVVTETSRLTEVLCTPQLELKKTLLDRMVHLLSRAYVLPVVGYIRKCLEKLNTDISLIRYFVTEVTSVSDVGKQPPEH